MELEQYLCERYSKRSAHCYKLIIRSYLRQMESPELARYKEVMDYMSRQHRKGKKPATLLSYMAAIKAYYDYLKESGKRNDHPCRHMRLKYRVDPRINVQDLFSSTELELLMEQPVREIERKPSTAIRDKVIMSLLVYQALTTKSIAAIELQNIQLEQATIYIKPETTLNGRTLELHPKQIMMLSRYINEERPVLNTINSNKLILTRQCKEENGCSAHDIIKVYRPLFLDRSLTPLNIRKSVIANLLKAGKDIRMVQVFAGHKSPMTTERYKQTGIEELSAAVLRYHPLG